MMQRAIHFEWGVLTDDMTLVAGSVWLDGTPRTGARASRQAGYVSDWGRWINLPFRTPVSEFFYQWCFRMAQQPTLNPRPILGWRNATTVLGGVKLNAALKLDVYTGNMSTLVAQGNTILSPATYYVLEVHVKIADAGGIIELRIDMNPECSFSGDTKPGAQTVCDGAYHGSLDGTEVNLDDLILNDLDNSDGLGNTSWPAGAHVSLLRPDADGDLLEWTPTPGPTHYTAIDEVPPSGADSLKSTVTGQIDELGLPDLPVEAQSVRAIKYEAFALKGSELAPSKLAMALKVGEANELWSPDLALPTSQGPIMHYYAGDPSVAEVNGGKLLLKSAA